MNNNARWKEFLMWWRDKRSEANLYSGGLLAQVIDEKIEKIKKSVR